MIGRSIVSAAKGSGINHIIWVTGMGIHHEVPGITGKMLDMLVRKYPEYVMAADTRSIVECGIYLG